MAPNYSSKTSKFGKMKGIPPLQSSKFLLVLIGGSSIMFVLFLGFVFLLLNSNSADCYGPVCGMDGKTYNTSCLANDAGIEIKNNGSCASCTDSDGGKELFTFGSASDENNSISDQCTDSLNLREAFCSGIFASSIELPCPTGYECELGVCIQAVCTDSDGGKDKSVFGQVEAGGSMMQDECISEFKLKEYYCENGTALSTELACGSGFYCDEGICVEAPCTDSDHGINLSIKGTVEKGSETFTDTCSGSLVREYYCMNGTVEHTDSECEDGFECVQGKCERTVCVDSDGGLAQFTRGTVTLGPDSYPDSCYSGTSVLEYYCYSDSVFRSEVMPCGTGSECVNGVCMAADCEETLEDFYDEDEKYTIASLDDSDEFVLSLDDVVELRNGYLLEFYSVDGEDAEFMVYSNIEDYRDGDDLCSVSITNGSSMSKFCSKTITKVAVTDLNDFEVELEADDYSVVEFYSQEGELTNWTDNDACEADVYAFDWFSADFFPYLDTESAGLNLDNKKIWILGQEATLKDVTDSSIRFYMDGKTYDLDDGDTFEYMDEYYFIELDFVDRGLKNIYIGLD
ncbi:hypothetical protein KJ780_00290 [Candidatus Micrarchaeota archaeon]|nr:hypothetical protein [Candidatus Micrarchaeota archaeon]